MSSSDRARRAREERVPLFVRLCPLSECSQPVAANTVLQKIELSSPISKRQFVDQVPFFLRSWGMSEHIGGKPIEPMLMYTLPLGSQYSDPLCDASSSLDCGVFAAY
jgi:hypothetical protein